MALIAVTHTPVTAKARQFDGTLDAFLDILGARSNSNLTATCTFDANGTFVGLQVSGGTVGLISLVIDDWAVFPDDPNEPAVVVPNSQATDFWQVT